MAEYWLHILIFFHLPLRLDLLDHVVHPNREGGGLSRYERFGGGVVGLVRHGHLAREDTHGAIDDTQVLYGVRLPLIPSIIYMSLLPLSLPYRLHHHSPTSQRSLLTHYLIFSYLIITTIRNKQLEIKINFIMIINALYGKN